MTLSKCHVDYSIFAVLSVIRLFVNLLCHYAECHCAECHYVECHCADCHYAECRYTECYLMKLY